MIECNSIIFFFSSIIVPAPFDVTQTHSRCSTQRDFIVEKF